MNTPGIEIPTMVGIRTLRDDRSVRPARFEAECGKALTYQIASTPTESAELLCAYAECIGKDERRWVQAASYAGRAVKLAYTAASPNYVLIAEAQSLYLEFSAPTLTKAEFRDRVDDFLQEIKGWRGKTNEYHANQINRTLDHLSYVGEYLTANRVFRDM